MSTGADEISENFSDMSVSGTSEKNDESVCEENVDYFLRIR